MVPVSFGQELKKLRERHFPGESLRRVASRLGLGEGFYSSLSRMEADEFLPTEEVLAAILKIYPLSEEEGQKLLSLHMLEKLNRGNLVGKNQDTLGHAMAFFRRVRKK